MRSVVRSAAGDMLYRVFSRVFQSDAMVIAVVRRVVGGRREDGGCGLI